MAAQGRRASAPAGGQYGPELCGAGEWLVEKHGTKTRRSWRKLPVGLDAGTGQIVATTLTAKEVDDGAEVGPLLDQVAGPVASFTADGAYDQEGVAAAGGLPEGLHRGVHDRGVPGDPTDGGP